MRGVKKIEDLGFPVLAAGIKLSRWIRWAGIVAAYNVPIECGEVEVMPGDFVFANYVGHGG